MAKVIKCKLDTDSIGKAIQEIRDYRYELLNKLDAFMDALLQDGLAMASERLASTVGDSHNAVTGKETILDEEDRIVATIFLYGSDALFIEFGAGIYYNNGNAHPQAAELGYGVGTYPSEHPPNRAINPGYWWYKDDNGAKHLSLGTQASMPIFYASETIRNNAVQRAMEIFRR